MPVQSNMDDLSSRLKEVFDGMLKSEEFQNAGKEVAKMMGNNVLAELHSGPYSYHKTGDLEQLISDSIKEAGPDKEDTTTRKMVIGFGNIDNMNGALIGGKRNVEYQHHMVDGHLRLIILKQETVLPKWIIAEFGAWNGATVPEQFNVGYSQRPHHQFLVGPSETSISNHHEITSGLGFFMADSSLMRHMGYEREAGHSPIKAGHIFSKGLEESKEDGYREIGDALKRFLVRNFGEVEVE